MKPSLLIYRFLVLVISFSAINPIVISTLKVSKSLNINEKSSIYLNEKINKLPIFIQPNFSKIFELKSIYKKLRYKWPSSFYLPTAVFYYLRWSLSSFILLIFIILNKDKSQRFINKLINLFFEKSAYSRHSKFFVLFIFFSFLSWILRLNWGFWNHGVWGWNMNYVQSLIPIEDFKRKEIKIINETKCKFFEKDFLLNALDLSKLPNNPYLKRESKTSEYYIKTNFFIAKDLEENKTSLLSNGVFGFVFPAVPLRTISSKGVNQFHMDIINLRLENYKKFNGPFRIPSKYAYPGHAPFNKEFTNNIEKVNYLAHLNVIYKINLITKKATVLNFDILSEYPLCHKTNKS